MATPTTPPPGHITAAPSQERFELLLKRQNGPTCGYISGDTASPIRCRPGFSCTAGIYMEFGCCNDVECDTGYHQACVDPVNNKCLVAGFDFGGGCNIFSSVLTCSNACVTHHLKSTQFNVIVSTYSSWSCGPTASTRIVLLTATGAGGNSGGGSGGSGNNGLSLDTILPGITGSVDTGNTGNSNTGNGGGSSPSSGGISSAAIGGIVAGGSIGLLLLGLGAWLIQRSCRGKRKPPANYSETMVSGWLDNQSQGRY